LVHESGTSAVYCSSSFLAKPAFLVVVIGRFHASSFYVALLFDLFGVKVASFSDIAGYRLFATTETSFSNRC